jgi:hypothetical protein
MKTNSVFLVFLGVTTVTALELGWELFRAVSRIKSDTMKAFSKNLGESSVDFYYRKQ